MRKKMNIDDLIMEVLREAGRPLTTVEIADMVLAKKEVCLDEIPLYLNRLEKTGLIVKKFDVKTKTYFWSLS